MRQKDPKTKCIKRKLSKCEKVCRTYDKVQTAYADLLEANNGIISFQCNVPLEDNSIGNYMTDFVCVKEDGSVIVRECVYRKNLFRPKTITLLDFSQHYWYQRVVTDWKVVIDREEK